jgi:hypothetical protein
MRRRIGQRLAAAFVACFCAGSALHAGDVVFPPGLRIGLAPPEGMLPSRDFPGFEDREHKAAILIVQLPPQAYYDGLKTIFAAKPAENITLGQRQMLAFDNGIAYVAAGREQSDVTYRKWLFLAQYQDITALLTVQIAETASEIYPDETVRAALKSVAFRPTPIQEQLDLMPFRIGDLAGFTVSQVAPDLGVLLSGGPSGDDFLGDPHVIISVDPGGPEQADERALFAQRLLASRPGFPELRIIGSEAMRIQGQQGHEIRAAFKDPRTGDMRLVQWVRFGPGAYLSVVAFARAEGWPALFPRFRAVRDSIEPR